MIDSDEPRALVRAHGISKSADLYAWATKLL